MAVKKTGLSRDLIFHPGATIADALEERGMSQAELAANTGVSTAYVCNVIAGKKDISANFALALEYALGVSKSFWLNLQANYDAELLEISEAETITEEERTARGALDEIVGYLRRIKKIPPRETMDQSILSLRKVLKISNIANLKNLIPAGNREQAMNGQFRIADRAEVNPYVLGAWIRLCQILGENRAVNACFCVEKVPELVAKLKGIMCARNADFQADMQALLAEYGIDFSVVQHFKGAPVQGYVTQKADGSYQMILTIRQSYADIFWFSLFHELGHIANGDVGKTVRFVDDGRDAEKERAADAFASGMLLQQDAYESFVRNRDFRIESIEHFADSQHVMPYVVIGRLQKEKILESNAFEDYKLMYRFSE